METVLYFIEKHFAVNPGMTGLTLYTILTSLVGVCKSIFNKKETFNWVAFAILAITVSIFAFCKAEPVHPGGFFIGLILAFSPILSLWARKRSCETSYYYNKNGKMVEEISVESKFGFGEWL